MLTSITRSCDLRTIGLKEASGSTNYARLTLVERVTVDKHLGYFGVISRVDYKGDNSQGFVSINRAPLKVMIGGREEGGRGSSLI